VAAAQARTVVKLLALEPTQRLHREYLLDLLWPDLPPPAAANNLHQALHVARRALVGADADGLLELRDHVVILRASGLVGGATAVRAGSGRPAASRGR
jgi:DNA-binding SARP family transcriptional activator